MANIPALSWGELWSVYRRSPAHIQKEILAQIDLDDILQYSSKKVIKEVMEEAPEELKPHHSIAPDVVLDAVNRVRREWGKKPLKRR